MKHIAQALKALDSGSLCNETRLSQAAKSLAYTCLRVIILGGNGLDISNPSSARIIKEAEHFNRKRVRERLNNDVRKLKKALNEYPDKLP